uniref:Uncharacterized protein LOC100377111 n=1 Tax=Saccoglossus kowalevskii TaxID=10224 RepID=A0ABM0LZV7_SACKO|nr:PREDICTED: uncharacterized protein LOC100377111 [Saccoglossus kowalevskii]
MIECADTGHRVPETFGSEFLNPGCSPLQLMVEFFNNTVKKRNNEGSDAIFGPNAVIGFGHKKNLTVKEVINEIVHLAWVFLGHGADPNVRDENNKTPLHDTLINCNDLSLAEVLSDNGADVNAKDCFGNTPLLSVCTSFPHGMNSIENPYQEVHSLESKDHAIPFLLSRPQIQINAQNKQDRTALFECMSRGDTRNVLRLLECRADPDIFGWVNDLSEHGRHVSPLFVSLMSSRVVCSTTPMMSNNYQFIAHLVDRGYFSTAKTYNELLDYIAEFPGCSHLGKIGPRLIHLLFGGTTTSLLQLCTRKLFQTCYMRSTDTLNSKLFPNSDELNLECYDHYGDYYESYLLGILNRSQFEFLIDILHLPKNAILNFEIELLRQRLLSKFFQHDWFDERSIGSHSDSENESDGEYW